MARRDDAPFGVVAHRRDDRDGDDADDSCFVVTIASLTTNLVCHVIGCLDRGDVTAAWLHAFVYTNLILATLSARRLDLSPPGSAAESRARIAGSIHMMLAFLVGTSFFLPLYGAILSWALLAAILSCFYKLGAFDP